MDWGENRGHVTFRGPEGLNVIDLVCFNGSLVCLNIDLFANYKEMNWKSIQTLQTDSMLVKLTDIKL